MSKRQSDDFETPTDAKRARLSENLESCPADLESRPRRSNLGTPLIRTTFASSGRPYRLNTTQRAQLRQRRLEFQTTNSENIEKTQTTVKNEPTAHRDQSSYSKEELIALIKKAEQELEARNTHEQKVKELQDSIETWKQGFNRVVEDLQSMLQERENKHTSKRLILQQLHVPIDVLKYLNDPED